MSGRAHTTWATWLATLLALACRNPGEPPRAAAMLGQWTYASPAVIRTPPALNAGLHVTLLVESASADRFSGRVLQWFAGDVGISPAAFGTVTGTVDDDGGVTLRIPRTAPGASALTTTGILERDVLTVNESWTGTEPGPFLAGGHFERVRTDTL